MSKKNNLIGYSISAGLLNNLVAYYAFDNNVLDSTPNAHNGTAVGSPSYVAGKQSNAINFQNDATLRYVTVPDSDDFSFTNGANDLPFSVSFWVQNLALSGTANFYISKRDAGAGQSEYTAAYSALNDISFTLYSNGNSAVFIQARSVVNPFGLSTWAYITLTYDGSGTASGMKIYVNGVDVTLTQSMTGVYTGMINTLSTLSFGLPLFGLLNTLKHRGYMDELAIWKDRELTPAEILFLYNGGLGTNYSNL